MTRHARKSARSKVDIFDDLFSTEAYEQLTQERVEHRAMTVSRSMAKSRKSGETNKT